MKIDNRDIFEQIGNAFYAIAAEQHIKPLEVGELKALISKDWLPRNFKSNESIVSDETHFIIMTMDTLEGAGTSAKSAFGEFSRFYNLHPEVFTVDLKKRILGTASEITKIFNADNPFENQELIALKELLAMAKVDQV